MRGLLVHRRIVFIGFGFNDPEVVRLLKIVGKYCSPTRPAFAFLAGFGSPDDRDSRLQFLEKYNVDIIPYTIVGDSHERLSQLLDVYGAFILRRSLQFSQRPRPCPNYDPETTGLLVYNQLVLREGQTVGSDVLGVLLRARALSLLKHKNNITIDDLRRDLSERANLAGVDAAATDSAAGTANRLETCIRTLQHDGLVEIVDGPTLRLTAAGENFLAKQVGAARRLEEQFAACIHQRACIVLTSDADAAARVAEAAESFLKDCIDRRALGVAMSWFSSRSDIKDYHVVALLQSLPEFMKQLSSAREALALTTVIREVLARPTEEELKFLGAALQAQFGVNVLGYAPDTVRARAAQISGTLFLLDSSTLIPLLGRSSVGYAQARLLLARLHEIDARVATTTLLAEEVAEHARWAIKQIGTGGSALTPDALAAAIGKAGLRSNVFLEGFLAELEAGVASVNFGDYLDAVCGSKRAHHGDSMAFVDPLERNGIRCRGLDEWEGFEDSLWAERDVWERRIADWRRQRSTFRHDRQVCAEAEALIIVDRFRDGLFQWDEGRLRDGYFVSNTRAIDRVANPTRPITMRPELLLQWLSTITACEVDELTALVDGLLWELTERGLSVVDRKRVATVFSPLIAASRERMEEELAAHSELVASRYGEPAVRSFAEIDEVEMPVAVESYNIQKVMMLEEELERERKAKEAAHARAKVSEKELRELASLRAQQKGRQMRARSRKRGAASRPGKRRKKRK
jgi:hypothetical protein